MKKKIKAWAVVTKEGSHLSMEDNKLVYNGFGFKFPSIFATIEGAKHFLQFHENSGLKIVECEISFKVV